MSNDSKQDIYDSLCRIMQTDFDRADRGTLSEKIASLQCWCADGMEKDSQKMLAVILLDALSKKLQAEHLGENLYLNRYEISQIQLFNILIDQFPFVKYSQLIANNAMLDVIRQHREVTLIDIGIGQGTQMCRVIDAARQIPGLEKLSVIGIEPFGAALDKARSSIENLQQNVPFELSFEGIHDVVEHIDVSALPGISGAVVVNASLALHHIQSADKRFETVARVRALEPKAFILIEPNVNHYETDYYRRFVQCYHHFYSIFQVIDRLDDVSQQDRNAVKMFFGREIEDILGKAEQDRFEKHEPALHWIERLQSNGFMLHPEDLHSPVDSVRGVEIKRQSPGFMGFTFEEETVLALMLARLV